MMLMILNDGETYTNLKGCIIIEVPDNPEDTIDDLDHLVKDAAEGFPGLGVRVVARFE